MSWRSSNGWPIGVSAAAANIGGGLA